MSINSDRKKRVALFQTLAQHNTKELDYEKNSTFITNIIRYVH